eukprot:scaffold183_cov108-Isochrysis_galbana.AAC.5
MTRAASLAQVLGGATRVDKDNDWASLLQRRYDRVECVGPAAHDQEHHRWQGQLRALLIPPKGARADARLERRAKVDLRAEGLASFLAIVN